MTRGMTLDDLRMRFAWPDVMPDVPPDPHSFLDKSTATYLARAVKPEMTCVVELGSWLGASTRIILDAAPNALVFAVDHWRGPASMHRKVHEHLRGKIPTLKETFLRNCWEYRDRLIPVQADTIEGMTLIRETGVRPDLVFIDADHTFDAVYRDISIAMTFFPGAVIVGDDWRAKAGQHELQRAVKRIAAERNMKIKRHGNAWGLKNR